MKCSNFASKPLTFLSLRAAMTAGRRSICCASRRFFTDAWCCRALFSLKFRIVFSWLFRSHVKLWNTPTIICNSRKPVFCNLDASTDNPILSHFPRGSWYLPTYSVYHLWRWWHYSYNCMLLLCHSSFSYSMCNMQDWNMFRLAIVTSNAV